MSLTGKVELTGLFSVFLTTHAFQKGGGSYIIKLNIFPPFHLLYLTLTRKHQLVILSLRLPLYFKPPSHLFQHTLQPERFVNLGIEPPKGVLLFGPPGTGKTLCARAVANRTDACFIRVIGSELVQKYVGEVSHSGPLLFILGVVGKDVK